MLSLLINRAKYLASQQQRWAQVHLPNRPIGPVLWRGIQLQGLPQQRSQNCRHRTRPSSDINLETATDGQSSSSTMQWTKISKEKLPKSNLEEASMFDRRRRSFPS
jgi:hypothetical protein